MTKIIISTLCFYILSYFSLWAADHVVVISIDGGRTDVLLRGDTPVLHQIVSKGSFTFWAETIDPSLTLIAHTSMLTGVPPERHGIDWNSYKESKGTVKVATVFEVLKNNNKTTAMFVAKEKFKHLFKKDTVDTFVFKENAKSDVIVDELLAFLAKKDLPHFTFVHLSDMDYTGHAKGWGSPEQEKAAGQVDGQIGRLLKALMDNKKYANNVNIIITADHGGHDKDHGETIPSDKVIPWLAWGKDIKTGHQINEKVSIMDTAATVLGLMQLPIPPRLAGKSDQRNIPKSLIQKTT